MTDKDELKDKIFDVLTESVLSTESDVKVFWR